MTGNAIRRERMYPWRLTFRFGTTMAEAMGGYSVALRRSHDSIRAMAKRDGYRPGSLRITVMRDPGYEPTVYVVLARWTSA